MRITIFAAGLGSVLAVVAACGAASSPPPKPIFGSAPPGPPFSTTISGEGVGPLGANAPDDRDAIARMFPGLEVTAEVNQSESHEVHEYTVSQRGKRALFVVMNAYRDGPDKLFRIDVFDPMFATATGIAVGATVSALAAKHADATCQFQRYDPEADIYGVEKRLYCETKALPRVAFDLDPDAWSGAVGAIPVQRLAGQKIVEISWVTPE